MCVSTAVEVAIPQLPLDKTTLVDSFTIMQTEILCNCLQWNDLFT